MNIDFHTVAGRRYTERYGGGWLLMRASTAWLEVALAAYFILHAAFLLCGVEALYAATNAALPGFAPILAVAHGFVGIGMFSCVMSSRRCERVYPFVLLLGTGLAGSDAALQSFAAGAANWPSAVTSVLEAALFLVVTVRGLLRWRRVNGG